MTLTKSYGQTLIGFILLFTGGYLVMDSITVHNGFSWGYSLFHVPTFGFTRPLGVNAGALLVTFLIGLIWLFADTKSKLAAVLTAGSVVAMIIGVLMSLQFTFRPQSLFMTIVMLSILAAGAGLTIKNLVLSRN